MDLKVGGKDGQCKCKFDNRVFEETTVAGVLTVRCQQCLDGQLGKDWTCSKCPHFAQEWVKSSSSYSCKCKNDYSQAGDGCITKVNEAAFE